MILVFEEVDRENFEKVRSGIKSIETRAGTAKYQAICVGDEIEFQCGTDVFGKKVIKKYQWSTVEAMCAEVPLKKVMPDIDTIDQVKIRYASYPNYPEKIKKFGILGLELGE